MRVVVLLETMWGAETRAAPRFFRINPDNFSGRRLYRLVDRDRSLIVTNCCPEMQCSARLHGVPDPAWVLENLTRLEPFALLLVCGKIAARTYAATGYDAGRRAMELKHPAARTWTNAELNRTAKLIRRKLNVRNSN